MEKNKKNNSNLNIDNSSSTKLPTPDYRHIENIVFYLNEIISHKKKKRQDLITAQEKLREYFNTNTTRPVQESVQLLNQAADHLEKYTKIKTFGSFFFKNVKKRREMISGFEAELRSAIDPEKPQKTYKN